MTTLLKENLQKAVSVVNRFISLRPTLPVLGNIYIKSVKGKLILRVTNLETSIEISTPAKTEEEWEITVPAKLLLEFLNTVRGKEATIELDKENFVVSTEETKGTLATISATEFPKPPFSDHPKEVVKFKAKDIYQIATKVAFAASQDEGKPILNSMYLTREDEKLTVVATDGYRLAKQVLQQESAMEDLLVPARTFTEALKVSSDLEEDELEIASDKDTNQLLIVGENFKVATRLISGTYPNYKQILPAKFVTSTIVNREDLLAAVKATAVFARDLGNVVTLNISEKKKMTISASTLQVGDGTTQLSLEVTGESLTISFNSHYFSDGLSALKSEKVKIDFSGQLSPALITSSEDPNFAYIVQPVKAQK